MPDDEIQGLVYTGRLRGVPRPTAFANMRAAAISAGSLFLLGVVAVSPVSLGLTSIDGVNVAGIRVISVIAAAAALSLIIGVPRIPTREMRDVGGAIAFVSPLVSTAVVIAAVVCAGPRLGVSAVFMIECPLLWFVFIRRPWAFAFTALLMTAYAIALVYIDAPAALEQWLLVFASATGAGVLVGGMATTVDEARKSEYAAKLELAKLNENLERRVAEQVDELERVGRLRRFLSPQVADFVMTDGAEDFLNAHDRDIAVFFVDLRDFTSFTNAVPAHRVVHVVNDYYGVVGTILDRYGATIGGFDGDGVFAFLGDPIARDDAASRSVAMARDVARALDDRLASWSVGKHSLGYGIGLAYGRAVLGLVGYVARQDYTPLGPVVNLAARLCASAHPGEIVVDARLRHMARLDAETVRRGEVDLKGFGVVETFALSR